LLQVAVERADREQHAVQLSAGTPLDGGGQALAQFGGRGGAQP